MQITRLNCSTPLYLRTTDEMLEEFEYLGSAKAREIVIENPVKIAEMVEKITPVQALVLLSELKARI